MSISRSAFPRFCVQHPLQSLSLQVSMAVTTIVFDPFRRHRSWRCRPFGGKTDRMLWAPTHDSGFGAVAVGGPAPRWFRTWALAVQPHSRSVAQVEAEPEAVMRDRSRPARPLRSRTWLRRGGLARQAAASSQDTAEPDRPPRGQQERRGV
jgi:hypothetical protein